MLLLLSLAVAHEPESCAQVREVRALAVAAALDTTTLDVLEDRVCPNRAPGGHVDAGALHHPDALPHREVALPKSRACRDLELMTELARIDGSDQQATIQRKAEVVCATGVEDVSDWDNGLTAQRSNGSWSYPNGLTARSSSGSWSYPSGLTAKGASGSWSYPNGLTARSSSGTWSQPNGLTVGESDAMLTWVCEQEPDRCMARAQRYRQTQDPELAALLLVGFAWEAR